MFGGLHGGTEFGSEPQRTALILAALGAMLTVSVLMSRAIGRRGLPVVLLFLVVGMLAGSEGIGGIAFDDYGLAFRLGTVALGLILFDGGLNTPATVLRATLGPAAVLATAGVAITAGIVAWFARLVGFSWSEALLLGAVVSSTDAAAVFSILKGSGLHLKKRVGGTLELESGLNDPMAVLLTVLLTRAAVSHEPLGWGLGLELVTQLGIGAAGGLGIGYLGRRLLQIPLFAGGLYPVLTLGLGCLAFGLPTLLYGSGFLAVYTAGVVLGNSELPYRASILRVHDFVAWFAQIVMFLALGLLVFPSELAPVMGSGLAIAVALALVGRPLAVVACLLPFRFSGREIALVSWIGLRGAIPIILACYPILAGAPGAKTIFNMVFFVVVVSALVQGGTVRIVTRWLGLEAISAPAPPATLEIGSSQPLEGQLMSFYIRSASAACGATMAELPFPEGAAAMLVVRGRELIAPRGGTRLEQGDHLYVFCKRDDRGLMQLMFGKPDE